LSFGTACSGIGGTICSGIVGTTWNGLSTIGRFFDNAEGKHHYSEPILSVGIEEALNQICFDYQKFLSRGGVYEW
jgi:hypothetical protein